MEVTYAVILSLLQITRSSSSLLLNSQQPPNSDLSEVIGDIIEHYFTDDRLLPVIQHIKLDQVIKYLNSKLYIPIVLVNNSNNQWKANSDSFHHKGHQFLLLGHDDKTFSHSLNLLINSTMWNSRARYLVVLKNRNKRTLESVIQGSASRFINNIIFVQEDASIGQTQSNNNLVYNVYTYFPFSEEKCADHSAGYLLDQWQNGEFIQGNELFSNKMLNLYQCPLRISMFDFPPMVILKKTEDGKLIGSGFENQIIFAASSKLNFTPQLTTPSDGLRWGIVASNGTGNGLLGDLLYRKADIGIGGVAINKDRYTYLDMTNTYHTACYTWSVPKAMLYPQWMSLILPYTLQIWALVFTSSIFTIIALVMVNVVRIDKVNAEKIPDVVFLVFAIFCSESVPQTPKSSRGRLIFVSYLWFCLIVISAYVSSLVSHLTIPKYMKDIDSLKELLDSTLSYGGHPNFLKLFRSEDETITKIMSNYIPDRNISKILDRVAKQRDFAMPYNKDSLIFTSLMKNYLGGKQSPLVHIVSGCTLTATLHAVLRKNSPYLKVFNDVVVHLTEGGIIQQWIIDLTRKDEIEFVEGTDKTTTVITVAELTGAFAILGLGLSFSTFVYLFSQLRLKLARAKSS